MNTKILILICILLEQMGIVNAADDSVYTPSTDIIWDLVDSIKLLLIFIFAIFILLEFSKTRIFWKIIRKISKYLSKITEKKREIVKKLRGGQKMCPISKIPLNEIDDRDLYTCPKCETSYHYSAVEPMGKCINCNLEIKIPR